MRISEKASRLLALASQELPLGEAARGSGLTERSAERFFDRLADDRLVEWSAAVDESALPGVSVIIPVRNRPQAIRACLSALAAVDYPRDRLEVIVVDDGSTDDTAAVVRQCDAALDVALVSLAPSRGPSEARNEGARRARFPVLAFTDSDCIVAPDWLRQQVVEFADRRVAAVGGRVDALDDGAWLQRYESARSPLDMGARPSAVRPRTLVPYVVSANLTVARDPFLASGGFSPSLPIGEDVDLVWRLIAAGYRVRYQPASRVKHDHRFALWPFLCRRAFYASSEVMLLERHPDNGRYLAMPATFIVAAVAAGLAAVSGLWFLVPLGIVPMSIEMALVARWVRQTGIDIPIADVARAILSGHGSVFYWGARSVARYYAIPVSLAALVVGLVWRPALWLLGAVGASYVVPAAGHWWSNRRRQRLLPFLAAFILDDLANHVGALNAALRFRSPRVLRTRFVLLGRDGPALGGAGA
jgi:mycofactocin system glycosyltransferase